MVVLFTQVAPGAQIQRFVEKACPGQPDIIFFKAIVGLFTFTGVGIEFGPIGTC